jgi:hypothetical protein
MLVFPTDWSPKNTSLYLASGETVAAAAVAIGSQSTGRYYLKTSPIETSSSLLPRFSSFFPSFL